ncbi:MAG: 6-phosphogluconolactonase [Hyphomonadaceae bacterium]|nr:6-phosphogluconolactonase [Hyphomonadaceae bacterium]
MTGTPAFAVCDSREAAADHIAYLLEGALRAQLTLQGRASLLLSGGSTPGPVFDRLATVELNWSAVTVGLVDERWVPDELGGSNAALLRQTLLTGRAEAARFVPMYNGAASPAEGLVEAEAAYAPLFEVPPLVLLGMGPDGHTASWFPGAKGLVEALDTGHSHMLAAIDATGAPVAGDMPHRMTVTAAAIARACFAVLYITGEEKRAVLENTGANLPIHHAERVLGDKLKEVWAP